MVTPLPLTIRTRDLVSSGHGSRDLRRAVETGDLVRLVPGSFVPREVWATLTDGEKHAARSHAVAARLTGPVALSHWSAAAVWGFPVPEDWPTAVQVTDPRRSTTTTRSRLQRRPGTLEADDVVLWEGVAVTSAARTAADIALTSSFATAVAVLDTGLRLHLLTKDGVRSHILRRPRATRRQSALAAVEFADGLAEYPGESFSRVGMAERGFVKPVLQMPFRDGRGLIGRVDFYWEEVGVVGEFDGQWKYTDRAYLRGRTAAEVIRAEKRRHVRLDAHPQVRRVLRWDYAVACNPDELARLLAAAGVPRYG